MHKKPTVGAIALVFLSLIFSLFIGFVINNVGGPNTVTFTQVFVPTIAVIGVLGIIGNISTMINNNKIDNASVQTAENILKNFEDAGDEKSKGLRKKSVLRNAG
jgi:hypothetical protein